jgi:hypothetical protein
MPGVLRIALIGSLLSRKPDPKDTDLLVTVSDDADLAPIAGAARRLKGHLQSINRGADVFVANPQEDYLGRLCPWRRCAPGVRRSCEALHCGRRPFLYDDQQVLRLAVELVRHPPVEVFPETIRRGPIPEDVEAILLWGLKAASEKLASKV